MSTEPREVELKFRVPRDAGESLLASLGRDPDRELLESTYFDTAGCSLRRAGLTLRVRCEGGRWLQTVKSSRASEGALGRGEWEAATAGDAPDLDHARRTPAGRILAEDAALAPKFTIVVDRRTVPLDASRGALSCSLDHGEVRGEGRSERFDELELELQSGETAALFDVAGDLARRFPLTLSFTTKPDRGFGLLAREDEPSFKFEPPTLTPEMTAGQAFRAVARAALEQIARNGEVICRRPSAEAVHQMRVGARRLRASLKVFRRVADDDRREAVAADLKWLAVELDPARDLDVFIEGAWRRAEERSPGAETDAASERIRAARDGAYARAQAATASDKLRMVLLDTLAWIEGGPWTEAQAPGAHARDAPGVDFARGALNRARRKVLRKKRDLRGASPEDRHKVRIRAKELRYAADVLSPLFEAHPKRAERFVGSLKDLLDDLGDLNDIATAGKLAGDYPPADELVACEARREGRLIAKACEHLADLKAAKPFWTA